MTQMEEKKNKYIFTYSNNEFISVNIQMSICYFYLLSRKSVVPVTSKIFHSERENGFATCLFSFLSKLMNGFNEFCFSGKPQLRLKPGYLNYQYVSIKIENLFKNLI